MVIRFVCKDYGFDCDFITKSEDVKGAIDEYSQHSNDEHGTILKGSPYAICVKKGLTTQIRIFTINRLVKYGLQFLYSEGM